jgi:hypothetical protein
MIRIFQHYCYSLQAALKERKGRREISTRGDWTMNTKKLALFGASAVVLAGVLVYALGIYPPASGRDGRGAIGQRDVYRAEQPTDASVNPNDAPVATADQLKNAVTLQNGQMFALSNGQMYQVQNGNFVALQNGQMYRMNDGQMVKMQDGFLYHMNHGELMRQLNTGELVHQLNVGQVVALQNGMMFKMMDNGRMLALGNEMSNQMQNGFARQ